MAAKDNMGRQFFQVSPQRRADPEDFTDLAEVDDWDDANNLIAEAKGYVSSERHNVPINNLLAHHPIEKERARSIMKSIKSSGYNQDEPIEIIGDKEGGTILNGHHRAIAARAAGLRQIPADVYDDGDIAQQIDVLKSYRY